jgi:hypothetical protein
MESASSTKEHALSSNPYSDNYLTNAQILPENFAVTTGLYSRCMGGNSMIIAMAKWPEEFTYTKALVLLNLVSRRHALLRHGC